MIIGIRRLTINKNNIVPTSPICLDVRVRDKKVKERERGDIVREQWPLEGSVIWSSVVKFSPMVSFDRHELTRWLTHPCPGVSIFWQVKSETPRGWAPTAAQS